MSGFGCTKDKLYMSIKQMRFTIFLLLSLLSYILLYTSLAHFKIVDVGRKIMPIVIQDKDESMLLLV